jgi:Protein of unknown function (DUF2905)
MPPGGLASLGKLLLGLAAALAILGGLLLLADRFPGLRIGRLPGDLAVERERFRLYVPITTSILLSVVLTLVLWLLGRRG